MPLRQEQRSTGSDSNTRPVRAFLHIGVTHNGPVTELANMALRVSVAERALPGLSAYRKQRFLAATARLLWLESFDWVPVRIPTAVNRFCGLRDSGKPLRPRDFRAAVRRIT